MTPPSSLSRSRHRTTLATAIALGAFATLWVGVVLSGTLIPLAPRYTLTELGSFGDVTTGAGINEHGQVVGASYFLDGTHHAFLYEAGQLQDLGTLGGRDSYANGINATGQVVGFSMTVVESTVAAFLFSGGDMRDIGSLGGPLSNASAINASGQVTGDSSLTGWFDSRAVLYSDGNMHDLGTLGGDASAGLAINDTGQITGYASLTGNADQHAFLYSNGLMEDLGTLGGALSLGFDINGLGQVAGSSTLSGFTSEHAFLYRDGSMRDLGMLPGYDSSAALGLNDDGDVTGYLTAPDQSDTAFLYTDGAMLDLNSLIDPQDPLAHRVHLQQGVDITNNGLILANGYNTDSNHLTAFILTPVSRQSGGGSLDWLLLTGLAALLAYRQRPTVDSAATSGR